MIYRYAKTKLLSIAHIIKLFNILYVGNLIYAHTSEEVYKVHDILNFNT